MKKTLSFLIWLLMAPMAANAGTFTHPIEYEVGWFLEDGSPTTADDPNRLRKVAKTFGYTDNRVDKWEVSKGNLTDGASIPWYVRWVVGGKFEPEFARPSALHDHYVTYDHRVRPAWNTHRMFYDALLDENVEAVRAKAMYLAVVTFGASWTTLQVGQPCDLFKNCVKSADEDYNFVEYFPGAEYSQERQAKLQALIEEIDAGTTVQDLDKIAIEARRSLKLPLGDEG